MLDSVRARLALWHTATLAILLIGFALGSYLFLERTMQRRMDRYLAETATAFAGELQAERADEGSNRRAVDETVKEFRLRDLGIVVYDSSWRAVASSVPPSRRARRRHSRAAVGPERAASAVLASTIGQALSARRADARPWLTVRAGGDGSRAFAMPVQMGGAPYTVAVVQPLHGEAETLETVRDAYLIVIPLVLLLAGIGGYLLARRSLAPVVEMSNRAARIGAANVHERLPVINPRDELGALARVFNDLLGRMAASIEQQRRFMADASHELRTPVAIMRGEADIALSRDSRTAGEYREALAVIGDEGRRLSNIVSDLFLLARADAGQAPLRRGELYLNDLVAECVRAVRSLAAQRSVELRVATCDECPYSGDEELLRRVLRNLLDNAIKYSGHGAVVDVALERTVPSYRIVVRDTGPGIPPEACGRLFERFYRVDKARSRSISSETGGAGLGLAIGRMVAEAHGGRLELVSSADSGSVFALTLPRVTDAGHGSAGHHALSAPGDSAGAEHATVGADR
ncbi:MAG TPA: ATP-binding protein [Gemmatimonadaceae bacterium]|nr:ATP-binding protein [Gemmatimonadaceae bacterium]